MQARLTQTAINGLTAVDCSGTDAKEEEEEEEEEEERLWWRRNMQGVGGEQDAEVEDASKAWGTCAGCHDDESSTNLCMWGCHVG
jgi:hypothetical protein